MVGGAKFQTTFLEWSKQSVNLFTLIFDALLVTWVLFAEKTPQEWRYQFSTVLGRALLLLVLYLVLEIMGWVHALLFAIAIGLTWANRPLYKPVQEGFEGGMKVSKIQGPLWFVERVFHETPEAIVEDRIRTDAVQEDQEAVATRTSR